MLRRIKELLRGQRGGSELIAIAIIAALVLLAAFGPGKTLLTKIGTKFTTMGICIENPTATGCP